MNELLKYLIESSIIISVFYGLFILFYKDDKNSGFNRAYLITSSLLAVVLPLFSLPIIAASQVENGISLHQAIQLPEIIIREDASVTSSQLRFTLGDMIAAVYISGLIIFLFRFLSELHGMFRHIRQYSNNLSRSENYIMIKTDGELPTCSFYKYLFWDNSQNFSEKETGFIIKHEEGHILQKHTLDLLYLEILRIIFWFNPIVHGYKKAMLAVHEFLADEFALANTNGKGFIALLGLQALHRHNMSLSNHFSKSQTIKRIKMIKSEKKKPAVLRWAVMATATLAMFYFFSCEQGQSVQEISSNTTDLPVLGEGWSYVSDGSLSPWISEKYNSLTADYPSGKFYIAKGNLGEFTDFNPVDIFEKYGFRTFLLADEGASRYAFLGKAGEEVVELNPPSVYKNRFNGEEIFTAVEDQPEPVGGMLTFYQYVANNLKYPKEAREAGIEGKVFIEFIIDTDGTIIDVKALKGIGNGCDEEAIRVIEAAPAWNPGKHKGRQVKVMMVLPITFKLG